MSTFIKKFSQSILLILMILNFSLALSAQDILINLELIPGEKPSVKVKWELLNDKKIFGEIISFLEEYADAQNLAERVSNFKAVNQKSQPLFVGHSNKNVFLPAMDVKTFSYQVNLTPPENKLTMAHISWLGSEQGLLMLNDLLPEFTEKDVSAGIVINTPSDWRVTTTERSIGEKDFEVKNISDAIFYVGKNIRENQTSLNKSTFGFITSDQWLFKDNVALRMAKTILADYRMIFGDINFYSIKVYLIRLPAEIGFNRWRAETRGSNVIILSSSLPFKSQAIQRIHEQLRHELFHLWIPNSLNLKGDYAWFYEGFAVYQALRTGTKLRQIRFVDFLDTISQAYNLVNRAERTYSFIDPSGNRWQDQSSSFYSKGLLVAFICDLTLIKNSKGKKNVEKILTRVFEKHSRNSPESEANASILKILEDYKELKDVVEKYIKGSEKIDLPQLLTSAGILNVGTSSNFRFSLKEKLNKQDKAILRKLGYN